MTPEERRALAEQITTNPLFEITLADMESAAIERLIFAKPEDTATAQLRVQAVRNFRSDLEQSLSTPTRRGAPT